MHNREGIRGSERPESRGGRDHQGGFVGPTILIGLGVLLLLSNLGMLQWSVWDTAWRLWPILLIAAGLDVLIGRRSGLGSLISALIVLALLAGGVWLITAPGGVDTGATGIGALGREIIGQSVSQSLDGARLAEVAIRPAAASLRVAGGAPVGKLVEGTVGVQAGEAATSDSRLASDVLYYSVESREARAVLGPWGGDRVWDLRLTDQAQLTLRVGMGAGQANLDLRGLKVNNLVAEIGAGQATVTFASGGKVQARLSVAMGQVVIRVPRGTAYRVTSKTALGTTKLPFGESRFGSSTVTSPGFDGAQDRTDVDVSCAMGSVVVQEY